MFLRPRPEGLTVDSGMTTYESFANKRVLFLYGYIRPWHQRNDIFSSHAVEDNLMLLASESDDPIWLFVNSDGGSIDDGFKLIDTMNLIPAPVYTVGKNCYSMGAVILASGEAEHRYILPHTKTMIHMASGTLAGTAADTKVQQLEIERAQDSIIKMFIERGATKSYDEILTDIDRDYWMNAQETVNYGIVDKVMEKNDMWTLLHA